MTATASNLQAVLPHVRGQYRFDVSLAETTWFRVGGKAEVVFRPADADDLAHFLQHKPAHMPVMALGATSNVIVRDAGIDGVVVRLGRGFAQMDVVDGNTLRVGAGCLDVHVAEFAAQHNIAGMEFLCGIPGGIGGALRMNAGAYGREMTDIVMSAEAVMPDGQIRTFSHDALGFSYRRCALPEGVIFVAATLRGSAGEEAVIRARMAEISANREASQPVRSKTGGSTFANPPAHKAWQLIDDAGCRGMMVGDAQVSVKHCNFLINTGAATAADIETLGEAVRDKVFTNSGIRLEWEIKRIGKA